LQVGDSLSSKISEAISGSGWLVVVLSTNSIKSDWVRKELNAALALELQRRNVFVLPVLIETCDIPLFLLDKVFADFRNSYENGFDSLLRSVVEAREI
jgi:hypothetical protein